MLSMLVLVILSIIFIADCSAFEPTAASSNQQVFRRDSLTYRHIPCSDVNTSKASRLNVPLIIIPGFAQSIDLYMPHLPALTQKRSVIVFQAMGTGTKAFPSDVSLPAQVKALATILDYEFGKDTQVDIAGFSMGGRIGLAAACLLHGRIRKLHVTGVGLQTSERAQVHYHAWKELLRQENLQGFAWSLLMSSYHASFLLQHQNHLVSWAESLSGSHMHKPQGLLALLEQTHNPEWSVENMASQLPGTCKIHLVVGQNDQMASLGSVQALSAKLNLSEDLLTVVSTCGHAVPMESPRIWRNSILQFLDDA